MAKQARHAVIPGGEDLPILDDNRPDLPAQARDRVATTRAICMK